MQSQSIFEKTHQVITYNKAATTVSLLLAPILTLCCSLHRPPYVPTKKSIAKAFGVPSIYASTMGYIIIAPAEALKRCNIQ